MSRHWREEFDSARHLDYMVIADSGGLSVGNLPKSELPKFAYFVNVSGFTFQFLSLAQIQECANFFSQKIHASGRFDFVSIDHWWQKWHERLPQKLFEESNRVQVIKALERAMLDFASGKCETRSAERGEGVGPLRRR
jgi:hypothetical protein